MCHEPTQGIAVFLEEVQVNSTNTDEEVSAGEQLGRLTGEVIKTVRDSIRQGFMDWGPRLMLAMYSCEIQASSKSYLSLSRPFKLSSIDHPNSRSPPLTSFLAPQPKSSAASTQPSPAAAATSSPNPSKKAPHSTASSPSSPSPSPSASQTRFENAPPAQHNHS